LDAMKWLKDQGAPFTESTYRWAVHNGNKENLRWLKENGCECDETITSLFS